MVSKKKRRECVSQRRHCVPPPRRHCERSEAIPDNRRLRQGLLRSCLPRNDDVGGRNDDV
jgi:hypothetical protein